MKDISGWLTPHEAQFLRKAAASVVDVSGVIVEIGSFHGKSTIQLASSGKAVYAIDPHKGEFSGGRTASTLSSFLRNIKRAEVDQYIRPLVKTSKAASRGWTKPISLLFIDGLHDFSHAQEDYILWTPHITRDGIVAMHDAFCGWPGAGSVAMNSIVRSADFREIGVVGSIIYGVRGEVSLIGQCIRFFRRVIIEISQWIYRQDMIPKSVSFVLVHRFLRIFLVNRFSSLG